MPNCFSLTRRGEDKPSSPISIDNAICEVLGVRPDERLYCEGWVDNIGFLMAMGSDLGSDDLRKRVTDWYPDYPEGTAKLLAILDFLEKNYTNSSWAEIGKK